jgi:hypothetical protein
MSGPVWAMMVWALRSPMSGMSSSRLVGQLGDQLLDEEIFHHAWYRQDGWVSQAFFFGLMLCSNRNTEFGSNVDLTFCSRSRFPA